MNLTDVADDVIHVSYQKERFKTVHPLFKKELLLLYVFITLFIYILILCSMWAPAAVFCHGVTATHAAHAPRPRTSNHREGTSSVRCRALYISIIILWMVRWESHTSKNTTGTFSVYSRVFKTNYYKKNRRTNLSEATHDAPSWWDVCNTDEFDAV